MSTGESDIFESPKALLTWAYEDTERFKQVERIFVDSEPYERFVEFDPELGWDAHRLRIKGELPPELRKLCSHIINDLRHALDQAYVAAAKRFGWVSSGRGDVLYFPWANDKTHLEGLLKKVSEKIHDIILQAEPYDTFKGDPATTDVVRVLGKIAGGNKHEVALTAYPVARPSQMHVNWDGPCQIPFPTHMWDGAKQQLTFLLTAPETKGECHLDMSSFVVLKDIEGLERTPARDVFEIWGTYAVDVIGKLERRVAEAA